MTLPDGPYRVYNVLTDEYLGGYDSEVAALLAHKGEPITIIYRPRMRKRR